MKDVEQRALATSPVKPFFGKRYIDDVISAVSGNEAERLLSHLSSVELSLQFTLERKKDRRLPFLDLNVYRGEQGNLETIVGTHRKSCSETFSDFRAKNNEPTLFILSRAMTVITSISERPNVSLVHVWKSIKKRSSFAKKKIQLYRSTQGGISLKSNRRYHQRLYLEA